jgi:hypothetical protein
MSIQRSKTKTGKRTSRADNFDGVYLLKLVLYIIFGSMWLKISNGSGLQIPIPLGFIIGFLFASHEHFRIDRKIEYAVLVIALFVGYLAPYGLYIDV